MTELRDLVEPLLSDPPHPAPELADLVARVDRRRRRRARAIGAGAVTAVVLVVVAMLALPRDTELRVGGGSPAPGATDGGTTLAPLDTDVVVTVTPASASLEVVRRVEIRNTSDQPFPLDCGGRLDLVRWNPFDSSWTWYGTLAPAADPPYLLQTQTVGATPCPDDPVVAPGGTFVVDLDLSRVVRTDGAGTIPASQQPLDPGSYRFGPSVMASSPLTVGGRFEITGSSTPPSPAPPTSAPKTGATVVDTYPLEGLAPAGEKLPTRIVVPDDNTVAISWKGWCNEPADHVTVTETEDEIEVRLSVGTFPVIDCVGEPDRWAMTFALPNRVQGRTVVARAGAADGELRADPTLLPGATSAGPGANAVDVSMLVSIDGPAPGTARFRVAYPIVDAGGATCSSGARTQSLPDGSVVMPRSQIDLTGDQAVNFHPCSGSFELSLDPSTKVIGEP
jgi:hypothetical protein